MDALEDDPLWFKDAIIYETHVKAYHDSNADGIGDFKGLTERLPYLEDLGITAIWLLPFYPSPLKDDGYDISNYFDVHPDYGRLQDFKGFLREAHRRGIRVITELILNHTSDQHLWFRKSRTSKPGSSSRDFYIWSDTPDRYKDARVIFKDFETSNWAWDPVAGAYYFHRFYAHQPDLNYDNPRVREAILQVVDFWLRMGVDGLRLDAVPYLFKREGTNCENLPETFAFLREIRKHIDGKFKARILLAEANQWPEDAAAYFGAGDMCHMAFHFPLMPRMFIGLQMEDRFPIVDILQQTPNIYEICAETCQWALFLRNHDELTLEMVTDEERDYMYRVYARDPRARINLGIRRRLAPLLDNDRRRIELVFAILFTLPGTPFIYYGNEIGMGDNYYLGDRNGVRTPMQWSPDRNAGFSMANPQQLYLPVVIDPEYHYESINVENQQRNLSSLLWWFKRAIAMRKRIKALGRGTTEFLFPDNAKVLAFIRTFKEETILIVANLSKLFQVVELDLSKYAGLTPQTTYSLIKFPVIRETPYVLTMGPYNYIWLYLRKIEETAVVREERSVPELRTSDGWSGVLQGAAREKLEADILPGYLRQCRWFGGKAGNIREIRIAESIPVGNTDAPYLLFLEVSYIEGQQELYLLPVSFAMTKKSEQGTEAPAAEGSPDASSPGEETARSKTFSEASPDSIIARLYIGKDEGILYDASYDDTFREFLLAMIARRKKIRGEKGELIGYQGRLFRKLLGGKGTQLSSHKLKAEQSNTSFVYEDTFYFKLFRKLSEGINPDEEIVRLLTEKVAFKSLAPFAGAIEYRDFDGALSTIGLLQRFIPSQRDGWNYTQDAILRYFEGVLAKSKEIKEIPKPPSSLFEIDSSRIPQVMQELIEGHFLEMSALLGKRTGEMHLALASIPEEPDFAPEPFSTLYQRSVFQSMRTLLRRNLQLLKNNSKKIPDALKDDALFILQSEQKILAFFQEFLNRKFSSIRMRIHGDYHLGQVLYTGKDFVIIDFEGEPARPLTERRLKQSPFKDAAGMVRSFHYVGYSALLKEASVRPADTASLQPWTDLWYRYVSGIFIGAYLQTVKDTLFVASDQNDLEIMLKAYLLEKAVYELGYELNNRPEWVAIPLQGVKDLIEGE